jgi:hypothetical protein
MLLTVLPLLADTPAAGTPVVCAKSNDMYRHLQSSKVTHLTAALHVPNPTALAVSSAVLLSEHSSRTASAATSSPEPWDAKTLIETPLINRPVGHVETADHVPQRPVLGLMVLVVVPAGVLHCSSTLLSAVSSPVEADNQQQQQQPQQQQQQQQQSTTRHVT